MGDIPPKVVLQIILAHVKMLRDDTTVSREYVCDSVAQLVKHSEGTNG